MSLTWKDAAATGLTGSGVVLYAAWLQGATLPLLSSPCALTGAVFVLGMAACGFGGADQALSAGHGALRVYATTASVLGGLALTVALAGLITGSPVLLGLLVTVAAVLWAMATLRHALARGPVRHLAPGGR
jgi:hypothetical protein